MLGNRESEELLSTSVGDVLPEQVVESVLTEKMAKYGHDKQLSH